MTLRQLRTRLRYWQKRLNLAEWTITVEWGSSTTEDLHGECWWDFELMLAAIKINPEKPDQEATLIHELCHVLWEGHIDSSTWEYNKNVERAINRMTAALLQDSDPTA